MIQDPQNIVNVFWAFLFSKTLIRLDGLHRQFSHAPVFWPWIKEKGWNRLHFSYWAQVLLLFSLLFVLSSFNGQYFNYHIEIFSVIQQLKFSTLEKKWWIFKTYKIQQDISWITNTVFFLLVPVSVAKFSPHFIVWLSIVFQRGFKSTFWDVFVGSGASGQGV